MEVVWAHGESRAVHGTEFPNTWKDTGLEDVTVLQLVVELGLLAVSPHWLKEKPTAGERIARITHQLFAVDATEL